MVKRISAAELNRLASDVGWFSVAPDELDEYGALATAVLKTIDLVLDDPLVSVDDTSCGDAGRDAGVPRTAQDDPLNAVIRWIDVSATGVDGPLSGLRIAVKDSIAVAGIPLTLGSAVLPDYVPVRDSVVTERLLAAGARLVAVTNMDDFAFSGGGETSANGPMCNPHDPCRSTGGSSGGSAAILSYPGVDGSIGTDQGGSIRVPASWCGVLGLKPTHGLVPYTGIVGIDATFDHAGPMATNVDVLGRLTLAIAGPDSRDPRQAGVTFDRGRIERALESTSTGFDGLRIGVVVEGFSEDDEPRRSTSRAIRQVAGRLRNAGAVVEEVSVPEHARAGGIAFAGFIEGMAASALGGGNGYHWQGRYEPHLAVALNEAFRTRGADLCPQIKLVTLLGEHLRRHYGGSVYAAAQNQRPALRAGYDRALARHDLLLMPTTPYPAFEIDPSLGLAQRALRGWEPLGNCAPLNMSGHPAISLPAASVDGMPVGAMVVASHFEDARLIDFAARYERTCGWDGSVTVSSNPTA